MTSVERMYSAYQAAKYVAERPVPGAIVECGVWKGGSIMIALQALLACGIRDRDVYLYDTFGGMVEPGGADVSFRGESAARTWTQETRDGSTAWCNASLAEVRENVRSTGYPLQRVQFVQGPVEKTIPGVLPSAVAWLRLDTDWYDSTYHELTHLYPRVTQGGVVIIDDYGHWQGARRATDRYLEELDTPVLLNRIDYTARLIVKV